jgi:hypothetical protein
MDKKYLSIVSHYESCLARHGDTHLGVDWPKRDDADPRYQVMLEAIRPGPRQTCTLLDFGCGASHLYEYMLRAGCRHIEYAGLDLSPKFVELSRRKFPHNTYYCLDILQTPDAIGEFDYIVMNGVFTEKRELTFDEMFDYFRQVLVQVFRKARAAAVFNVMSAHVDWERDDLFHLPLDTLARFLKAELSRHFTIRNDYGLYEYTACVYKEPGKWRRS